MRTRIAILVQLPKGVSPGQRFRIEQFGFLLESNNIKADTFSFIDPATYRVLYRPGHLFQKISGVCKGYVRRLSFLFKAYRYQYILLQREATPVGPPFFEWFLCKVLRKRVIHDFDDAIWIPDGQSGNKLLKYLKSYWKVKYIIKWSYKVSVGNEYLAAYARQYNSNVVIIPTCVDTTNTYRTEGKAVNTIPVIGWTGSHSTLPYLQILVPVLEQLEQEATFQFLVICDRKPEFQLKSLRFLPWNKSSEITDLLKMDIGVMPLVNDAWSEGKCGFKIIQYLALEIPAIASPVGVNSVIIEEGENGMLCHTPDEWLYALRKLLKDQALRKYMGERGRQKIVAQYSVQANGAAFIALFK